MPNVLSPKAKSSRRRCACASSKPERRRISRGRGCACWWASAWARPTLPIFPPPASADGGIGHRNRRHLHRRPARGPAGRLRARRAQRRFAALLGRHSKHRHRRAIQAARAPKKPRFPGIRASPTPKAPPSRLLRRARVRQFARIPGLLSHQQLLPEHSRPWRAKGDAMERDYWYSSARSHAKLDSPAAIGTARRRADRAPFRRAQSAHSESAGDLRFGDRAVAARQHLRGGGGIPSIATLRFLAGKLGERIGVGKRHRHRRRNHARPLRHLAIRRRRRAVAPHCGDRSRRAPKLPAEQLRGASSWACLPPATRRAASPEMPAWATGISFSKRASARPKR
jgi:hypothetical protein